MAEIKILKFDTFGDHAEHDSVNDSLTVQGITTGTGGASHGGNIDMNNNLITELAPGVAGTDAVNKDQLDAAVAGLSWQEPADVDGYLGSETVANINGGSPSAGDVYVMSDAGTLTAGSLSVAAGDVVEYDGANWIQIVAGVGGFVADGTRLIASTTGTLQAPLAAGDEGKLVDFDGTSLTGTEVTSLDGWAILIKGENAINENKAYVYDGTVPTGSWIQFSNIPAGIVAGDGINDNAGTFEIELDAAESGLALTGTSPNATLGLDWSTLYNDAKPVKASDLASNANGQGASIIGVEDSAGNFTATNVEGVLAELYTLAEAKDTRPTLPSASAFDEGDIVYVDAAGKLAVFDPSSTGIDEIGAVLSAATAADEDISWAAEGKLINVIDGNMAGTASVGDRLFWTGAAHTDSFAAIPSGDIILVTGVATNVTNGSKQYAVQIERKGRKA